LRILLIDELSSVNLNGIIGFVLNSGLHFDLIAVFGVMVGCMYMIFVHSLCFLMIYVFFVFASLGGAFLTYRA